MSIKTNYEIKFFIDFETKSITTSGSETAAQMSSMDKKKPDFGNLVTLSF
jgi:hypothetical protein